MNDKHPHGFDVLFAAVFCLCVWLGTAWFVSIVNERFGLAVIAHLAALARGGA